MPSINDCLSVFLSALLAATPVVAGDLIVGVNVVGNQPDSVLEQLKQAGVTTMRVPLSYKHPMESKLKFLAQAYQDGIGTILVIPPDAGGSGLHTRAEDLTRHLWAMPPMSDNDPEGFTRWFTPILGMLDAVGVHLTALELGNEINNSQFNGDFTEDQTSGRMLGIKDLNNPADAEGKKLAESFKGYLKIAAALKTIRDHSKINANTPIISAGLVGGVAGPRTGQKFDWAAGFDTLQYLRENGIDDLVDGYGIHTYQSLNPDKTSSERLSELNKEFFKLCGRNKPCWVTEWGFTNTDKSCPLRDDVRRKTVAVMRQTYKTLADQGKIKNITYFSWNDPDWGIFRCGSLTEAGKLALEPP